MVWRYAGYDKDILHAQNLAGVPGIELRPVENWPVAGSLSALILRGEFEAELRGALEMSKFEDQVD